MGGWGFFFGAERKELIMARGKIRKIVPEKEETDQLTKEQEKPVDRLFEVAKVAVPERKTKYSCGCPVIHAIKRRCIKHMVE